MRKWEVIFGRALNILKKNSDLVNLCKLRGDLLDNKLLFHLVVMVQGSEVQRLTDSGCLPSEISGIEENREAINPEPETLNL